MNVNMSNSESTTVNLSANIHVGTQTDRQTDILKEWHWVAAPEATTLTATKA